VILVPHRLTSSTLVSRQLVIMGGAPLETTVRNDLARAFASTFDHMALVGNPALNQPTGIQFWPGVINLPVTTLNLIYRDLITAEELVELEKVSLNSFGYIANPSVKRRLRDTPKFPGAENGPDVWASITNPRSSPILTEPRIFFGNFQNVILAVWSEGFELSVDPYSRAGSGQVVIVGHLYGSVGIRLARAVGFTDVIPTPLREQERKNQRRRKPHERGPTIQTRLPIHFIQRDRTPRQLSMW
jgi:HK97 family phage major capsid protein